MEMSRDIEFGGLAPLLLIRRGIPIIEDTPPFGPKAGDKDVIHKVGGRDEFGYGGVDVCLAEISWTEAAPYNPVALVGLLWVCRHVRDVSYTIPHVCISGLVLSLLMDISGRSRPRISAALVHILPV